MATLRLVLWVVLALIIPIALFRALSGDASALPTILASVAIVLAGFNLYLQWLGPPRIRLLKSAEGVQFRGGMYSAGRPFEAFGVALPLIASNDGSRAGMLTSFNVDTASVQYEPAKPTSFSIAFSSLEWEKLPIGGGNANRRLYPVPLPLALPKDAMEKVSFCARLEGFGEPDEIARELRDLKGFSVAFSYEAGTQTRQARRTERAEFTYDGLRNALAAYWEGTDAWRKLGSIVRGGPLA